jgi:predicted nucleic acid-binding protein
MMIVVATNVVSELMRERPAPTVVSWMNNQEAGSHFLTAISLHLAAASALAPVAGLILAARSSLG